MNYRRIKILFFIGSLRSGGKERRLLELLSYLKRNINQYDIMLVLRQKLIDYSIFYDLNIPYFILTERYKKKDLTLSIRFYRICKHYKPDIIHVWGATPAFVSLFAVVFLSIPLINNQITSAPPNYKKWSMTNLLNRVNFYFSDIILSNSQAGLDVYKPPLKKSKVIYNGIRLERFEGLFTISSIKEKYHINTRYAVIMVGSFSKNKNFDLFLGVADSITHKRDDITFVCVGDGENFERLYKKYKHNRNIIFTGRINEVEALINACDIGVLLSNKKVHGEGISNTITEYMALKKPVIANDAGGTKEIIIHGKNGYLLLTDSLIELQNHILELIDNKDKRNDMGNIARRTIEENFSIEKMGSSFTALYKRF